MTFRLRCIEQGVGRGDTATTATKAGLSPILPRK